MASPAARGIATAVIGVAWLIFVIVYLVFYAESTGFSFFQNIAVLLTSVLVVGAVISIMWISFGMKQAKKSADKKSAEMIPSSWRISLSAVLAIGWVIFALLFIAFYSENFSFIENIAILLITLLIVGVLFILMWVGYGMRQARAHGKLPRKPK
jgi:hypothetical protein